MTIRITAEEDNKSSVSGAEKTPLPVTSPPNETVTPPTTNETEHKRKSSLEEAIAKHPHQFMSDKEVGEHWIFQIMMFFYYTICGWFYNHSVVGIEKVPKDTGALLIGRHTTHNQDIFFGIAFTYALSGRVMRGLLHRIVFMFYPWVAYLGLVPGQRNTAVQLLKSGFLVGVLPGGGEEAMYGHEHAYDLHPRWGDRTGFADVARKAGVPIIPYFVRNAEEMRFNPFFYIFNLIGFTRFYERLCTYCQKHIKPVGWVLKQCGLYTWFVMSWLSIPIPVKTTGYVGEPLYFKPDDDLHYITEKCRQGLQDLINEHQPHKHNYLIGIQERFGLFQNFSEKGELVVDNKKDQ